jgi:hypothetical protein
MGLSHCHLALFYLSVLSQVLQDLVPPQLSLGYPCTLFIIRSSVSRICLLQLNLGSLCTLLNNLSNHGKELRDYWSRILPGLLEASPTKEGEREREEGEREESVEGAFWGANLSCMRNLQEYFGARLICQSGVVTYVSSFARGSLPHLHAGKKLYFLLHLKFCRAA